jgi:S1-C subfamily serine protease
MRLILLLLAGLLLGPSDLKAQTRRANPFGEGGSPGYKVNNAYNKTFDLSKIGGIGREETMAMFEKIWHAYRSQHQLDSAGNFFESDSSSTPDTIEAKAHFYVFIKRNPQEITITDKQECPQCRGKGRKWNPATMSDEDCDRCDATGKLANVYKFTLTHSGELPPGIAKYLPKKPADANGKSAQPSGSSDAPLGDDMEAQIREATRKQLSELLSSKLTGVAPKGFGVSKAGFSAPNGIHWQLDLDFQNKEAIKVSAATVKITFFEKGYGSKLTIVAMNDIRLVLDENNHATVSFSDFTYPELKFSGSMKSKADMLANYAAVLKQLKRANDLFISIKGVAPTSAQQAIDIEESTIFRIRRDVEGSAPTQAKTPGDSTADSKSKTFGSGMVFTRDGHIFTNHHVIGKSTNVFIVVYENGQMTSKLPAMIVSKDPRSDLAILQCKEWKPPVGAPASPPPLVSSSQCKLGAQVFVLGYPLPGTVSSNVKYTKGDVSDMSGLDDDSSKIQHTAQIQPGNSGGPMALMDGRVVGIVVSSLSESYALKTSGALPQGVNFSIKSDYLLTMASIAGIEVPKGQPASEAVDHVKAYTVQIMCEK